MTLWPCALAIAIAAGAAWTESSGAGEPQRQRFGGRNRNRGWGGGFGGGGRNRTPARYPTEDDIFPANTFTFATMEYWSSRSEPRGFGWNTDYPDAGYNFMLRLEEITTIQINRELNGEPLQVVVRLTDPFLFDFPLIFTSDVGTMELGEDEADALRKYLLLGGMLHVDDFWGPSAWNQWEYEIGQVLPPEKYPIKTIPMDHPIFHIVFEITEVPQVPSIRFWRTYGTAQTSERGGLSETPQMLGIFDETDRLMVIMTFNTDIADGWERERLDQEYFEEFSVKRSYPLGINIVVYAMTH